MLSFAQKPFDRSERRIQAKRRRSIFGIEIIGGASATIGHSFAHCPHFTQISRRVSVLSPIRTGVPAVCKQVGHTTGKRQSFTARVVSTLWFLLERRSNFILNITGWAFELSTHSDAQLPQRIDSPTGRPGWSVNRIGIPDIS